MVFTITSKINLLIDLILLARAIPMAGLQRLLINQKGAIMYSNHLCKQRWYRDIIKEQQEKETCTLIIRARKISFELYGIPDPFKQKEEETNDKE